MNKKFIIIRGVSGSGKSTIAKSLINSIENHNMRTVWAEADHFFTDFITGEYNFDPRFLNQAHRTCMQKIENGLEDDLVGLVIVSNTFTTKKELKPYFELAQKYEIKPQVITVQANFGDVHNVPPEVVQKMKERFDFGCVEDLMVEYGF